jgi:plasmid maintenance system antidote protein VapI
MKRNAKVLNDEQKAEAYIYPVKLNATQKAEAASQLAEARKKSQAAMSASDQLLAQLMQLRFQLEEYIKSEEFHAGKTFGHFLKEYLSLGKKKRREFAAEINIHETLLSQLISDRREPSDSIIIRLELHSNKSIPAAYWYRIVEKRREHLLIHNRQLRKQEEKHVKRRLEVAL